MTKKTPFVIAGLVAASLALAGCGGPADNTDDTVVTTPDSTVSSTPDETMPPPVTEDDEVVTEDAGSSDATADETVEIASLTDGATLEYPAGTVVLLKADDPTKWSVVAMSDVATLESLPSDNAAGYELAVQINSGSGSIGVLNADSGQMITVNVTGS